MNGVDRDIFIGGVTVFCEASNQGIDGIVACAHSIVNRHNAGKWFSGKTLASCCLVASAFSSWSTKDPNRIRAMETSPNDETMALCIEAMKHAMAGETLDPTDGATHYYTGPEPEWAKPETGAVFTVQIGAHRFYKEVK